MSQSLKRSSADSSETEPQSASGRTKTEGEEAVGPEVMSVEEGAAQEKAEGAVDGEHTCSECGMVFQRRYTLIMHMLKHEKSRSFKCTVRICSVTTAYIVYIVPCTYIKCWGNCFFGSQYQQIIVFFFPSTLVK